MHKTFNKPYITNKKSLICIHTRGKSVYLYIGGIGVKIELPPPNPGYKTAYRNAKVFLYIGGKSILSTGYPQPQKSRVS